MKLKRSGHGFSLGIGIGLLVFGILLGGALTATFFAQLSFLAADVLSWSQGSKMLHEKEPNNTFVTATPITMGYETTGTISSKNDVDTYVFHLTAAARVRIELRSVPYQYQMKIYDGAYQLVASSSRMGFDESASVITIPNAGAYYIQIQQLGKTTFLSPPYTITVNILTPLGD